MRLQGYEANSAVPLGFDTETLGGKNTRLVFIRPRSRNPPSRKHTAFKEPHCGWEEGSIQGHTACVSEQAVLSGSCCGQRADGRVRGS